MGQMSVEQFVEVTEAVAKTNEPNYGWLLILGIIPVLLGYWLNKKKNTNGNRSTN